MSTSEFDEDRAEEEMGASYDVHDFERVLEILEEWPEALRDGLFWARRGEMLMQLGEYHSSEESYATSAALGHDVRIGLGVLFERMGRADEAAVLYRDVLAAEPDDVSALIDLGTLEESAGRFESALRLLARAYELDPTAGWQYGACLVEVGRDAEALVVLDAAIAAGARQARLDRALLLKSGMSAGQFLREALMIGPSATPPGIVLHLTDIGELSLAEQIGREALAAGDESMYGPMAALLHRLGQEEEAVALNERAIETGDGDYLRDDS